MSAITSVLTVREVAERLRTSERFVLDELRRKNLRGSKLGTGWRITEADLVTYLDAQGQRVTSEEIALWSNSALDMSG